VEQVFGLLRALGVKGPPPPRGVSRSRRASRHRAGSLPAGACTPVVGVHISARRENQQWPAENFVAFIRAIAKRRDLRFLLLWAPGEADNPSIRRWRKARAIVRACDGVPILPWPTEALSRLIAALALCDYAVCANGGAMHLAAALGKPILCFFGDSPPERWRLGIRRTSCCSPRVAISRT